MRKLYTSSINRYFLEEFILVFFFLSLTIPVIKVNEKRLGIQVNNSDLSYFGKLFRNPGARLLT